MVACHHDNIFVNSILITDPIPAIQRQSFSAFNSPPPPWYKNLEANSARVRTIQGRRIHVLQLAEAVLKAVLVTLISTVATISVEKIRHYNIEKREESLHHEDFDHW
jgi:hypothetical protein